MSVTKARLAGTDRRDGRGRTMGRGLSESHDSSLVRKYAKEGLYTDILSLVHEYTKEGSCTNILSVS